MKPLLFAFAFISIAGCSSKAVTSTELTHLSEGDLDVTVSDSHSRQNTALGLSVGSTESINLDVKRGRWFLDSPTTCAVADKKTMQLRLAGARSLLAYRCKPADAWALAHIAETGVHLDCGANGGTGAEPDYSTAKTFLERIDVLAKCAVDETISHKRRENAMVHLAVDVGRATKSDARVAELLLRMLDELRAKKVDGAEWPSAIWKMEHNQGVAGAESFTLAPGVYPELQRQSVARLAKATAPDEIYALAAIADGRDPGFVEAATNAMKPLVALPASGKNTATIALLLGPMLTTAPDRGAKLGCDVLRAGVESGTAALASKPWKTKCAAITTAVRALPDYSKTWLDEQCAAPKPLVLEEFPKQVVDDKWKRQTLDDASFKKSPHDFVPWQPALVTAACPPSK